MTSHDTTAAGCFVPGHNCWTTARATRFHVIRDGERYFRLVRDAILRARHSVLVLSWDVTAGTDLTPKEAPGAIPSRLGPFLSYAARRTPGMQCCILTWDYGLLFALERDPLTRWRLGWAMPRNVRLAFDDHHPIGACHHQKVVVIDDTLAFSGSMDLTGHRWDTTGHRLDDPARLDPRGKPYDPYHEVQAMVEGPAAAALGALARERWRAIGVTDIPPPVAPGPSLWPADVEPDFTDADVAIARTLPGMPSQVAVRECETLYLSAIARAKHTIYVENQYFTHGGIADALAARLREPDGPEIVLVVPRGGEGWLDRNTIRIMRNELFLKVVAADAYDRLRLVHPMASRQRDVSTFIHSKVLVVDDDLVLVGSANTNRRSMGMDTECDLAVAARQAGDRAAITAIRSQLIAEHLDLTAAAMTSAIRDHGSIRAVIDACQQDDRTLVRFTSADLLTGPLDDAVRYAVDPDGPTTVDVEADDRHTPGRVPLVPIEPLLVAIGIVLGWWRGAALAAIATTALAIAGYAAGRWNWKPVAARQITAKSRRAIRQLGATGARGIAVLHLTHIAPPAAIHITSGALRLPFHSYVFGTTMGLAPLVLGLTGLGALARHALTPFSLINLLITAIAAAVLLGGAWTLRTFLLAREFAPSPRRRTSEFG